MERALARSDGRKKPFLLKLVLVGKLGVGKSGVNACVPRGRAGTLLNFLALHVQGLLFVLCTKLVVIVFVFRTIHFVCVPLNTT